MITYKRYFNTKFFSTASVSKPVIKGIENIQHFWANSVRTGLLEIFDQLNFSSDTKILIPAFAPHGIVLPAKKKKIKILFYKLTETLAPDFEHIDQLMLSNKDIKAIFLIHFFGFPRFVQNDIVKLKEHKVLIIEDCAHTIISDINNNKYNIGKMGDISFFSLPKILPVPDGSLFIINTPSVEIERIKFRKTFLNCITIWSSFLQLHCQTQANKSSTKIQCKIFELISKILHVLYYWTICHQNNVHSMSSISWEILQNLNIEELVQHRIGNTKVLIDNLKEEKWKFAFDQFDNFVVTGLPLVSNEKSKLIKELKKQHINTLSYTKYWWFVPFNKTSLFTDEKEFHDNHFLLPVSENCSKQEMCIIADVINNYA